MSDHDGDPGRPRAVSWDLTAPPTRATVGWPADHDATVYHLPRHSEVRFALPGGREYRAKDVQVYVQARGDAVRTIEVHAEPQTVDQAADHAAALVSEWGMAGPSLDGWRAAATAAARKGQNMPHTARQTDGPLTPGGPTMDLELLSSLDDQKPVLLEVGFAWLD